MEKKSAKADTKVKKKPSIKENTPPFQIKLRRQSIKTAPATLKSKNSARKTTAQPGKIKRKPTTKKAKKILNEPSLQADKSFYSFSGLYILKEMLSSEKNINIQVFSLESIEYLEGFLIFNNFAYKICFTSNIPKTIPKKAILVLLQDTTSFDLPAHPQIILYSNVYDRRFISYSFSITLSEKKKLFSDTFSIEANKSSSLTSLRTNPIDHSKLTASALSTRQALLVFTLTRESAFSKICADIFSVEPSINNSFMIRCDLNSLASMRICKKTGERYALTISKETIEEICAKVGFGKLYRI
ncbi:hypothetical protein ENBRE01_1763 [Enteropsectra breve]|nr:hypothetical protein ENBRE01_1763 [Enteropsectra breve]